MAPDEAVSTIKQIDTAFFEGSHSLCQPFHPLQHLTNRIVKLDEGKNYCYAVKGLNLSDENSALVHYIQVISSFHDDSNGLFDL